MSGIPDEWPDPDAEWVWGEPDPYPGSRGVLFDFSADNEFHYAAGEVTDGAPMRFRVGPAEYDMPTHAKPGDQFEFKGTDQGAKMTLYRLRRWPRRRWVPSTHTLHPRGADS